MKDMKTIKRQLRNIEYVKLLKTLSPEERDLLSKKYSTYTYRAINVPMNKIRDLGSAKIIFKDAITNLEVTLNDKTLNNIKCHGFFTDYRRRHYIDCSGYVNMTDEQLIKRHLTKLSSDRRIRIAKQKQKQAQKILKEKAKTNQLNVGSRTAAQTIINHLRAQYNIQ